MKPSFETALWMIGGGALGAVVDFLTENMNTTAVNWRHLAIAVIVGGIRPILPLFRTPPGTYTVPIQKDKP